MVILQDSEKNIIGLYGTLSKASKAAKVSYKWLTSKSGDVRTIKKWIFTIIDKE